MTNHIIRKDTHEPLGVHVFPEPSGRMSDDQFDLRRLIGRLLKRAHLIGIVLVLVLVPTAIASFLATPLYRSTALMEVNSDPARVMPYNDVADTTGGAGNLENYMGTQEQLLRGTSLRARVQKRLETDFKDQPAVAEIPELFDRFSLRKIEKSQLFELSYQAENPEAAATIVNLFAEEFAKQNFEMRQATRLSAEQSLKEELAVSNSGCRCPKTS